MLSSWLWRRSETRSAHLLGAAGGVMTRRQYDMVTLNGTEREKEHGGHHDCGGFGQAVYYMANRAAIMHWQKWRRLRFVWWSSRLHAAAPELLPAVAQIAYRCHTWYGLVHPDAIRVRPGMRVSVTWPPCGGLSDWARGHHALAVLRCVYGGVTFLCR